MKLAQPVHANHNKQNYCRKNQLYSISHHTPCARHHYQYEHQSIRTSSWPSARHHRPDLTRRMGQATDSIRQYRSALWTIRVRMYIVHNKPKPPRTSAIHYERYTHAMYRSSTRSTIQSPTQCFSFLLATVAVWGHPCTSSGGLLVCRPSCSCLYRRLYGNRRRYLGTSLTMAQILVLAFAVCCKCASSSPSV